MTSLTQQYRSFVVTDPKGVLVDGKRFPLGTSVPKLGAADGILRVYLRFNQIGPDDSKQVNIADAEIADTARRDDLQTLNRFRTEISDSLQAWKDADLLGRSSAEAVTTKEAALVALANGDFGDDKTSAKKVGDQITELQCSLSLAKSKLKQSQATLETSGESIVETIHQALLFAEQLVQKGFDTAKAEVGLILEGIIRKDVYQDGELARARAVILEKSPQWQQASRRQAAASYLSNEARPFHGRSDDVRADGALRALNALVEIETALLPVEEPETVS